MVTKFKRIYSFINAHPLAKRKPLAAYLRFIIWQIQSSLNKTLIVKPYVGKVRFYAKKGLHGVTGNIYVGLHEFNDMGFLLHFLRAEDTFFDIGANVGAYTLLASGYIGAKSVTFEPVPSTFSILEKNIQLNHLQKKVVLHNKALGNKNGIIKFTANYDTVNHALAEHEVDEDYLEVAVAKLDDYMDCLPILLKIDVEGFETEVINGAHKTLEDSTLKAIIIELNGSGIRFGYDEDKIRQKLASQGFKPFQYDPFTRKIAPLLSYGNHNTLYLRDIGFVEKRLLSAPTFSVFNQDI